MSRLVFDSEGPFYSFQSFIAPRFSELVTLGAAAISHSFSHTNIVPFKVVWEGNCDKTKTHIEYTRAQNVTWQQNNKKKGARSKAQIVYDCRKLN
jgi:hypothetical protein